MGIQQIKICLLLPDHQCPCLHSVLVWDMIGGVDFPIIQVEIALYGNFKIWFDLDSVDWGGGTTGEG